MVSTVESRPLRLRVVRGIARSIVLDLEEIANVAGIAHVVHLAMGLIEGIPVWASRAAPPVLPIVALPVYGKAVL